MLNITGLNNFYYLLDFHDMRCKYEKVLSIIHRQCNKEPEEGDVFIVMSKNQRLVRLFLNMHQNCRNCDIFSFSGHINEIGDFVKKIYENKYRNEAKL
jgi:hypothetical protein